MKINKIGKGASNQDVANTINDIVDWIDQLEKMKILPSSVANRMPQSLDLGALVTVAQLRNIGINV
jgi:hypothetical protein